jgi:hypothetical protein
MRWAKLRELSRRWLDRKISNIVRDAEANIRDKIEAWSVPHPKALLALCFGWVIGRFKRFPTEYRTLAVKAPCVSGWLARRDQRDACRELSQKFWPLRPAAVAFIFGDWHGTAR